MSEFATSRPSDYISAAEAVRALGVRRQTLYSYVSRGWLRSLKQVGQKEHLYALEDVERLKARARARRGHAAVAAGAMHWGDPIIPTTITEITPEGPRYRTHLALDLARQRTSFEAVAELLWSGVRHDEPVRWKLAPVPPEVDRLIASAAVPSNDHLLELFSLLVLTLGMTRGTVSERIQSGSTLPAARQIVQTLVGCFGYAAGGRFAPLREGEGIVEGLARACGLEASDRNHEALEATLTLLADHELSPGAFAARVAASSGSALHPCVVSAICTTAGLQTGRVFDRVEDLLSGAADRKELLRRTRGLYGKGSTPPGFSHPLYPGGDPRALYLLDLVRRRFRPDRRLEAIFGFIEDAEAEFDLHPRQELAVVTLGIATGLPARCSGPLFALARTAGWVAHVLEQRLTGTLLRPRARFGAAAAG